MDANNNDKDDDYRVIPFHDPNLFCVRIKSGPLGQVPVKNLSHSKFYYW